MRRTTDPKIDRLRTSWLALDTTDATWLASVADEVPAAAGTSIGHRRFAHVVLSGPDAGTVVDAGEPPVVLRGAGSVLVLTVSDLRELASRRGTVRAARPALQPVARPAV